MLRAKHEGFAISIRIALDNMRKHGIWVGRDLANSAISLAGE